MAFTETRALPVESASKSSVDAAIYDDSDYPQTAHPGRELFTASLFVLIVIGLLVWGGWKVISLL